MDDNSDRLYNLSILEASQLIRNRDLSPVELTEAFIDRIKDQNPSLNAYITVTEDLAFIQARAAEQEILSGLYKGSLHGIPIALRIYLIRRESKRLLDPSSLKTGFLKEIPQSLLG